MKIFFFPLSLLSAVAFGPATLAQAQKPQEQQPNVTSVVVQNGKGIVMPGGAGTYRVSWRAEGGERRDKSRAIEQAFEAKNYKQALTLVRGEIDRDPSLENTYASSRYRAIAHVNFADFQRRVHTALTNTSGDVSVYRTFCQMIASDPDLPPEAYRLGLGLVDEAVQKKQWPFFFLGNKAQMELHLGHKAGAVRAQNAAVEAADADPRCPAGLRERLRDMLTKLKTVAGK